MIGAQEVINRIVSRGRRPAFKSAEAHHLRALFAVHGHGDWRAKVWTDEAGRTLAEGSAIYPAPNVFQPRDADDGKWLKSNQQRTLREAIARDREAGGPGWLEPVVVWPVMDELLLVDGHHRLEAYRHAEGGLTRPIPVEVREVAFVEAMEAVNMNDKLPYTRDERTERSWFMLQQYILECSLNPAFDMPTRAEVARRYGVSPKTVQRQRVILGGMYRNVRLVFDPRGMSWAEAWQRARLQVNGEYEAAIDMAERIRRRKATIARKVSAVVEDLPNREPSVFDEALLEHFPEYRTWRQETDEGEADEADEGDEFLTEWRE